MYNFFEGREKVLNAFDSKIFPIKTKGAGYLKSKPSNLKTLTSKQMLQRLPIALGKTMENVRKHRDIKLVTTDKRRNQLVSEPNYHITKQFSENLLAIEMKKTKVKMNKANISRLVNIRN